MFSKFNDSTKNLYFAQMIVNNFLKFSIFRTNSTVLKKKIIVIMIDSYAHKAKCFVFVEKISKLSTLIKFSGRSLKLTLCNDKVFKS